MADQGDRVVRIEGLGFGGEGWARTDTGRYLAVPHTLPGDRVRVRPGPFRRGRAIAAVAEWLERSDAHVDPECGHYARCSGCALRHVTLDEERRFKLEAAAQILRRYGPDVDRELPIEWVEGAGRSGHRSRGRFRVERRDGRTHLGLREVGPSGRIVDVRDCPAHTPRFRELMIAVGRVLEGGSVGDGVEGVQIRTSDPPGDDLILIDVREGLNTRAKAALASLGQRFGASLGIAAGDRGLEMLAGRPAVWLELAVGAGDRTARVEAPASSWSHASPEGGRRLAEWVAERVAEREPRGVLDLCAGLGTLTLRLAPLVEWVIAVDEDRGALLALREAAERAGLDRVSIRPGRLATILRKLRRELPRDRRPELAVINPMRRPLGRGQLVDLAPLGPADVIYLGPSPRSAARDASLLSEWGYRIRRAAAVDLHPATAQVMLALCLSRLGERDD